VGTLSLIFGLALIGIGLFFAFGGLMSFGETDKGFVDFPLGMGTGIILLAIGSVLIIKYDSDKKKEKNS